MLGPSSGWLQTSQLSYLNNGGKMDQQKRALLCCDFYFQKMKSVGHNKSYSPLIPASASILSRNPVTGTGAFSVPAVSLAQCLID